MRVAIVSPAEFAARAGVDVQPHFSVLVEPPNAHGERTFVLATCVDGEPHSRATASLDYLRALAERLPVGHATGAARWPLATAVFQGDDNPRRLPSCSWQSKVGWAEIGLIPDLYFYQARGYEAYRPDITDWSARRAAVIWRGSTTGLVGFPLERLDELPRYRLCKAAAALGATADIKISSIVQVIGDPAPVAQRLADEGLLGAFVPMDRMSDYKLMIDIDGISSAWNFFAKARLGCCTLKVESEWTQWFSPRIEPWRHYVPVRADFADLEDKVAWCLTNDDEAEWIGARARNLAHGTRFETEMLAAARTLLAPAEAALDVG